MGKFRRSHQNQADLAGVDARSTAAALAGLGALVDMQRALTFDACVDPATGTSLDDFALAAHRSQAVQRLLSEVV